jgi:multidrug resistance efflux pump
VPIQIEIARRTIAAAQADCAEAEESLKFTRDDVEKGVDEATASLKPAQASLTLAELEYTRYTRLEQTGASRTQRRPQVTQSRDSAQAQVEASEAKLTEARASLTRTDVARRTLEAAQESEQRGATVAIAHRSGDAA